MFKNESVFSKVLEENWYTISGSINNTSIGKISYVMVTLGKSMTKIYLQLFRV